MFHAAAACRAARRPPSLALAHPTGPESSSRRRPGRGAGDCSGRTHGRLPAARSRRRPDLAPARDDRSSRTLQALAARGRPAHHQDGARSLPGAAPGLPPRRVHPEVLAGARSVSRDRAQRAQGELGRARVPGRVGVRVARRRPRADPARARSTRRHHGGPLHHHAGAGHGLALRLERGGRLPLPAGVRAGGARQGPRRDLAPGIGSARERDPDGARVHQRLAPGRPGHRAARHGRAVRAHPRPGAGEAQAAQRRVGGHLPGLHRRGRARRRDPGRLDVDRVPRPRAEPNRAADA